MKIDPELISCALEEAFKQGKVAPPGSIRLTFLTAHWESVSSTFVLISTPAWKSSTNKDAHLRLEIRGDGIWVRRTGNGGAPGGAVQRMQGLYRRLIGRLMFNEVRRRRNDGYCGYGPSGWPFRFHIRQFRSLSRSVDAVR